MYVLAFLTLGTNAADDPFSYDQFLTIILNRAIFSQSLVMAIRVSTPRNPQLRSSKVKRLPFAFISESQSINIDHVAQELDERCFVRYRDHVPYDRCGPTKMPHP